ncbi:MAG TPA: TCR/Tet family MFS transporter [Planctomycetota bacterium]|nr:TCR/Tet family MFS transporter [Planctomycetota bacterium]
MTTEGGNPGRRRAAFAFIFMTVLFDVLALGVIIPVLPKLVESFVGGDTPKAAHLYGLFGTVWALMQFLCSPFLGVLSDRFGRRPVILLSCLGLGLDYFAMALAPSLAWLFVGRVVSGITAASIGAAGAYIADVTPPEKRAANFGMLGAAWGLGFVIGPALGGILGGQSPRLPFWVAGGLSLINAAYGVFVLPESLPRERRSAFSWKKANPVGALVLLRSYPRLAGLAFVFMLYQLAHQVLPSVFVLYTGHRYGWEAIDVGSCLAAVGVCGVIVQGGLVRPIVARLGERRAMLTGLVFGMAGFSIYGLAHNGRGIWTGIPVFAFMGLFGPSTQGLMSRAVDPTQQGQLQGANSCLTGITGLIGPGLFTATFAEFIRPGRSWQLPGAPFLLAAALLAVAFLLTLAMARPERAKVAN